MELSHDWENLLDVTRVIQSAENKAHLQNNLFPCSLTKQESVEWKAQNKIYTIQEQSELQIESKSFSQLTEK